MEKRIKVLMVCLGNICRSPMAQGILESLASQRGIDVEVDSAGTAAYHVGEAPDTRSILTARKHNIDISKQRGRRFNVMDFDHFDQIFVMDKSNLRNVLDLARNETDRRKVDLMLNQLNASSNDEVSDPYYGGDQGFENVFQQLEAACETFLDKIVAHD